MTGLCFTFTTCNVVLGLVCARVSGLGSRLHSVNKMGVWRNVIANWPYMVLWLGMYEV